LRLFSVSYLKAIAFFWLKCYLRRISFFHSGIPVMTSHPDTTAAQPNRRDFLTLAAGAVGAAGVVCAALPLVDTLSPAADVLALANTEVDISKVSPGQSITVMWRGKPVFIRRRTPEEVETAQSDDSIKDFRDPQLDSARAPKSEWLVVVGQCTHLGCVPSGQKLGDSRGEFGGWFCPCHGSHYDTSGRIRKGPAPLNLAVPPYKFVSDTKIVIGQTA
jgi:ubiquinol-cytochrome c reductase iron-sulfur subunit